MRAVLIVALALCACPSPTAGTTDATSTSTSTSTTTTSGSTSATSTSTTDAPTTTAAAMPDLPPPCPVGSEGCPCTGGGACDGGLACEDGTCAPSCPVGGEGCPCTLGDGCDPGLVCARDVCVGKPEVSPPCPSQKHSNCCGNGAIDEFEECDIGFELNVEGAACTPLCKVSVCGDGYLHDPMEACDGEEFCADDCTFLTCGDGEVQDYEWCEKTRPSDPECTDLCTDARKLVFITSAHYKGGELGGLDGAHAICQMHADMAGLGVKVRAFLGTTHENSPAMSLPLHTAIPLVDVNGNYMGQDFNDFCGAGDFANIPDEFGNPHPGCATKHGDTNIWAWSIWLIDYVDYPTCDGWTNTAVTGGATVSPCGMAGFGATCDAAAPIHCIEL